MTLDNSNTLANSTLVDNQGTCPQDQPQAHSIGRLRVAASPKRCCGTSLFGTRLEFLNRLKLKEESQALVDQLKDGWAGKARDRLSQQLVDTSWEEATIEQLSEACYSLGILANARAQATKTATATATGTVQDRHEAPQAASAQDRWPFKKKERTAVHSQSRGAGP